MKAVVGIIITLLVLGGIGFFMAKNGEEPAASTAPQSTNADTTETEQSSPDQEPEAAEQTNAVSIRNSSYSPSAITVKKGTTVTWTNNDPIEHDIVPDSPSDAFKGSDGLLANGESYSFTFDTVGTYTYHCTPHPFMKGTVVVTE